MGLRVIEAPEPIVSLETMKQHLRIDDDETEFDEQIEEMIAAATDLLDGPQGELQRSLGPQTLQYVLDTWPQGDPCNGGAFKLPLPPLIEVTAVKYIDADGDEQTLDPEAGDYRVDKVSEPGWIAPGEDGWPSTLETLNAITIEYRAGYESDGSSSNTPLPPRVIQAVKLIVGYWFANREAAGDRTLTEIPLGARHLVDSLRVFAG